MAIEEATEGEIPFLGLEWDLTDPETMLVVAIVASIAFAMYHTFDAVGQAIAGWVNQQVSNLTNVSVGGSDGSAEGAFGGGA